MTLNSLSKMVLITNRIVIYHLGDNKTQIKNTRITFSIQKQTVVQFKF